MMINIEVIRSENSDLNKLVLEFQKEKWGTFEESYTLDSLTSFVLNPENYLLVAYIDKNVVGELEAYNLRKLDSRKMEMLLYSIETKKEFRGLGVGKALIEKLRDIAIANGSHEVWVLTEEENILANALYKNMGVEFKVCDQVMYNYPLK